MDDAMRFGEAYSSGKFERCDVSLSLIYFRLVGCDSGKLSGFKLVPIMAAQLNCFVNNKTRPKWRVLISPGWLIYKTLCLNVHVQATLWSFCCSNFSVEKKLVQLDEICRFPQSSRYRTSVICFYNSNMLQYATHAWTVQCALRNSSWCDYAFCVPSLCNTKPVM